MTKRSVHKKMGWNPFLICPITRCQIEYRTSLSPFATYEIEAAFHWRLVTCKRCLAGRKS